MKDLKIEEYNISQMTIEKDIISWKGHVIRVSGILRIWISHAPKKPFPLNLVLILLMLALSCSKVLNLSVMLVILTAYVLVHLSFRKTHGKSNGKNHLNLELCDGTVYSFVAGNEAFADTLLETLKNLLTVGSGEFHSDILFEGDGKIIDQLEPVRTTESVDIVGAELFEKLELEFESELVQKSDRNTMRELKKLYTHYVKKTDIDQEILTLINEARDLTVKNDRNGLTSVFGRFVTLGLISDCNELGLDCLLQEIKSAIY